MKKQIKLSLSIDEASKEHEQQFGFNSEGEINSSPAESFKAGVEFAQRWISVDDELPPCSDEDILIKGIDYKGHGNMPDIGYMHSSNENKPSKENFISLSGEITEVTHWRYLELN